MLSLEQAQSEILTRIRPAREIETVALDQASGRFVAAELRALVDNPAFDNSAMDGYALNTADLAGHDYRLPLAGESSCGDMPGALRPGTAMRIFTGAPLPDGADTVVIQEDVKAEDGEVAFPKSVRPDQHIRRRGEDFRKSDLLYAPGRRLTAYDLALISSAGVSTIPVYKKARVLVVATGDELVAPGTPLKPGRIYESNRLATLVQLRQMNVTAVDGGTLRDDPDALRALLKSNADFDFIITSGGASVGDYDLVKQVFSEIGEINFWRVRIKPGKPVAFGRVGESTHFFALPGNPVSSLVTFKLFVEPALIAWHHGTPQPLELPAVTANGFRRRPGRTEFLRARLQTDEGKLTVIALRGQGSHMLGPLRETNAFIRVDADSSGFDLGDVVAVIPLTLDVS